MKRLAFDDLACLPVLQFYEGAFRKATGVSLKVVPPQEPQRRLSYGETESGRCPLIELRDLLRGLSKTRTDPKPSRI